jgi:hypothetical protein
MMKINKSFIKFRMYITFKSDFHYDRKNELTVKSIVLN